MEEIKHITIEDLGELLDNIPYGVLVWSVSSPTDLGSCKNVLVNDAAAKLISVSSGAAIGRTVKETMPGILDTILPIVFKASMKLNQPRRVISLTYGSKDATENHYRVELVPFADSKYITAIFVNISALIRLQGEIEEHLKNLERTNRFMVGREIKMAELKSTEETHNPIFSEDVLDFLFLL